MAPGMGFALDDAQQELAEDLGNAQNYFASKGTDGISRALHQTDRAEREALAANLDQIEVQRARERSEDTAHLLTSNALQPRSLSSSMTPATRMPPNKPSSPMTNIAASRKLKSASG